MTASTLQRLERILVVVPWLLEHEGATVEEVQERFGITRQELADDLDVLGYCGLPGYGGGDLVEASIVGDRVSVRMADFFRRPLALSVREAITLLLAARALAALPGLVPSPALQRAIAKLEAVLGLDVDRAIALDLSAPGDELLPQLRRAVESRAVLRLRYRSASKGETTQRDVEPWAVVGAQGAWYLQGWCRSAQAPRDFRLDRIQQVEPTGERARTQRPARPEPPAYRPTAGDEEVVVRLGPEAWWVAERVVADEVVDEADGQRLLRLRTPALEWIARLLLRVVPDVDVVAPPALGARLDELVAATLSRYGDPSR